MKLTVIIITALFLTSCNEHKNEATLSPNIDNTQKAVDTSLPSSTIQPHPRLNSQDVTENPDLKKLYGPNFTVNNEIEIVQNKITYDADFKPSINITIRNNMTVNLIAVEIVINPSGPQEKCPTKSIKKKLSLLPNKTISIKQKVNISDEDCKLKEGRIFIGDCIFSNGMKISMLQDLLRNFDAY